MVLCALRVLLLFFSSELVSLNWGSGVAHSRSVSVRLSLSLSLVLSDGVWFALLNSLPSPPHFSSVVNKHPEPAPRRTSVVNRKQLSSPTSQRSLHPLEAWVHAQPEPQPLSPPPGAEADRPGLSGAGGGGLGGAGLGGGVQVATVKPQVLTQLSAEESR